MTVKQEEEEITKYNLRMPAALYDALARRAAMNRRSLNNEIVIILERYQDVREVLDLPKQTGEAQIV